MGANRLEWKEMTPPPTLNKAASPQTEPATSEDAAASLPLNRLKRRVVFKAWIIAILGALLTVSIPFAKPIYLYYAITPEKKERPLVGLDMPNMTNRAILSWSIASITEVMTLGFGDIDVMLPKRKPRFTEKGWETFMDAFDSLQVRETFKQSQLVLTTVPSNTPVILAQGVNLENVYQWVVQMPVIMTYATNNNVMRKQRATVMLTIVRIPAEENITGIAIRSWEQM
jgi:intracellular multiplication protein IcmL